MDAGTQAPAQTVVQGTSKALECAMTPRTTEGAEAVEQEPNTPSAARPSAGHPPEPHRPGADTPVCGAAR